MPRPWTREEQNQKLNEIKKLYVKEGKTIAQVGKILGIANSTAFERLQRFGIPSNPKFKRRQDIVLPTVHTSNLAEFFGVMLGDGKLSHFQVAVNLGTKELSYARYVVELIAGIFKARPKIGIRGNGYKDVYLGSVAISEWLRREGLVYNKVSAQVDVPGWIFDTDAFMKGFLRGFFDTDGSIYKLRWGRQIAFNNRSIPLLKSTRDMLLCLGYSPSKVSGFKVYVTRKTEVKKFFKEIHPSNEKHQMRFRKFTTEKGQVL